MSITFTFFANNFLLSSILTEPYYHASVYFLDAVNCSLLIDFVRSKKFINRLSIIRSMRVEINKYIVIDSKICHGIPTFKDTRIMVWQVLDLLGAGITPDEIIKNYFPRLTKESIFSR